MVIKPIPSYFYRDLILYFHDINDPNAEEVAKLLSWARLVSSKSGAGAVVVDTHAPEFKVDVWDEDVVITSFTYAHPCHLTLATLRNHFGDKFYVTFG